MADWLNTVFSGFDGAMFSFMHDLAVNAGGFFYPFFKFISFLGEGGWFAIVCGVIALLFKSTRKVGFAVLIGLFFGTIMNNSIIKNLVSRPRPYTANDTYFSWYEFVGASHTGKNSFPSGHSACTMAATIAWILTSKKKYRFLGLVFAILMGLSRVFLIVHYTTDVIAGLIVGAVAGTIAFLIVRFIYKKLEKYQDIEYCNFLINADISSFFRNYKDK